MKIEIIIGTVFSQIAVEGNAVERKQVYDIVDKCTSFHRKNYFFSKMYKQGKWDGKKHLFNLKTKTFPTGLVYRIIAVLDKEGLVESVAMCDTGALEVAATLYLPSYDDGREHRQYQKDAVTVTASQTRGVFRLATNAGKTLIFSDVIQQYSDLKTLVIVPNKTLLYQTVRKLKESTGDDVGTIGDGAFETEQRILVATIQTLGSDARKKAVVSLLSQIELLIVDETHHIGINKWYKIAMLCPAKYRYGFSGTAFDRTDEADMMLEAACGPMLMEVTNKDLIGMAVSVPVKVYMHDEDNLTIRSGDVKDYRDLVQQGIVHNPYRNQTVIRIAKEAMAKEQSVLISIKHIEHGKLLLQMLKEEGLDSVSAYVFGEVSGADREILLDGFRDNTLKILVASAVMEEGVDIPNIEVLIRAGGGKAKIGTLQLVGRGLRKPTEGQKTVLHLHDFIDTTQRRHLLAHSKIRMKDYEGEGFEFIPMKKEGELF